MNKEIKVLVCYNEPASFYDNYLGKDCKNKSELNDLSESGFLHSLDHIIESLKVNFENVQSLSVNHDIMKLVKQLQKISPDIIFNFVESVEGNSYYESYIAGLFDLLGYAYTGNDSLALGNCLIKSRTKQILKSLNIRTPKYFLAEYRIKNNLDKFDLKFPVIAKLQHEDASIGISEFSVIGSMKDLKTHLRYLFKNYSQDVMLEEYITGRELNVSILGEKILPISEILFDGLPSHYPKIITYEAKWSPESIYYKHTTPNCPAIIDEATSKKIRSIALAAYKALGCRDYARVDIRLTKRNIPYVIEVNPNPDISLDSGFNRSSAAANLSYAHLLNEIAGFAIKRIEL
ncbi:MAG: ATP-grasp domain-containing protein [Bacteroidetes bacterium]|nr:ATP-grasp domain-containing protein [Bacteroidota bacterium]